MKWAALAVAVAAAVTGMTCSRTEPPQASKQSQPASDAANARLEISLDTGGAMKMNGAPLDVTVRKDGKPVTDVDVSVELRMPPSGAMGEMRTGTELKPAGEGHYRGQVDMMMAGQWNAIVRVKRAGQVVATHTQPVTAQ